MKYLLFLFAVLFAVSACDGPIQFASVAGKPPKESKKSSQGEPEQKIKKVVKDEMKKKIGGKDRKTINISETVSKKDLGKKKTIVTNINVKNVIVEEKQKKKAEKSKKVEKKEVKKKKEVKDKVKVVERIVEKVVVKEKAAPPEKKLDILFYMEDRDTGCLRNVVAYSENKGFLKSLNHLDWQVSFSYYSQKKLAMLPLEVSNGQSYNTNMKQKDWSKYFNKRAVPDYVLSKGEYTQEQADHLFNTTLTAFHPEGGTAVGLNTNPVLYWAVFNPLLGLDTLLSKKPKDSVRSDSHTVVLLFDYDFPYYSSEEWNDFFNKHKNVSLIAVSYRSSNVSNLIPILEKEEYDFEFLPACDNDNSPAQLVQAIKNKVK